VSLQTYSEHGIHFLYPPDWKLHREIQGATVAISVTSPETTFLTIWLMQERPNPQTMLDSALDAFEEDYDSVDLYRSETEICEYPSLKCDVEFVSLELINSATIYALRTGRFSVLILGQGTDHELEHSRPILEAMIDSFECDVDDDIMKA
jgi:hypothetical protein